MHAIRNPEYSLQRSAWKSSVCNCVRRTQSYCRLESSFIVRFTLVRWDDTDSAAQEQGRKWMTLTTCSTFRVPRRSCSLVASFVVFDALEFSLNWSFTLVALDKKENAVPMQTRVIIFLAWRKQNNTTQSTCIQDDLSYKVGTHEGTRPCD